MSIKFAIIGTSKITKLFLNAAMQDNRFILKAVYSRSTHHAQAFAQQFDCELVFDDLTRLAKCDEIDAVYIASPNSCHAEQAMMMLDAGKHVLCEKPIAANCRELEQMIICAQQQNVCLMEAMLSTFLPNFIQIKENIAKLGELRKLSANFCQYSSRYSAYLQGELPNTFNPHFANGSLMDIGIYPLYVAISLLGMPDEVQSQCYKLASGVDGCGELLLQYHSAKQMQATVSHSKVSTGENIGELQGELGRLVWQHSSTFNEVTLILNNGEKQNISLEQHDNRMVYECQHFFDLIENKQIESPVNSWQLSLSVLQIIEQVRNKHHIVYPNDS